jgi:hypothetical protein
MKTNNNIEKMSKEDLLEEAGKLKYEINSYFLATKKHEERMLYLVKNVVYKPIVLIVTSITLFYMRKIYCGYLG